MRSKLIAAIGAIAVAFLLVTNPVIADAARQITGKQIKNNTVTTQDIKNNNLKGRDVKDKSLSGADIRDGSLVTADLDASAMQIKSLRRLAFEGSVALTNESLVFADSATVTVDGNDVVVVASEMQFDVLAEGDDIDYGTCIRPVGVVTPPAFLDSVDFFDVDAAAISQSVLGVQGSGVPSAGSYDVGPCVSPFLGTWSLTDVAGTVMVIDGTNTGPLGRSLTKGGTGGRN